MTKTIKKKKVVKRKAVKDDLNQDGRNLAVPELPAKFVQALADEVAKTVASRFPSMPKRPSRSKKRKKYDNPIFFDTSAIIDGRVFDVIRLGVLTGTAIIPESILLELKHVADSQDVVLY